MRPELSRRAGKVMSLIPLHEHKMVRTELEKVQTFDELPKHIREIIEQAEALAKTNPLPS